MRKKRSALLALAAGVVVAGGIAASAATLGGLNSVSLGADQTVVAGCDSDGIGLSYNTAYSAATHGYAVGSVTLTGVASDCNTLPFKLTLSSDSAQLAEVTGTVNATGGSSPSQTISLSSPVASSDVTHAALVISGTVTSAP